MSGPWLRLVLPAADHEVEGLEALLLEQGAVSVAVQARDDTTPRFAVPGEPEPALWVNCELEALFEASREPLELLAALADAGLTLETAHIGLLADQDWQQTFRQQFAPMRFAGDLWVVPSWHEPPAGARHQLRLDPGMAFGTGTHPTTGLCLDWLGEANLNGASVLDYGCGSGILAIAAERLGAASIMGVDIDPDACVVARTNAAQNHCQRLRIGLPAELAQHETFDVLVGNLLLNPLLVLRERFATLLRPGGALVMSGLLAEQCEAVSAAYADDFALEPPVLREGWALLAGRRRPC